jgi:hypothetical protein
MMPRAGADIDEEAWPSAMDISSGSVWPGLT